MTKKVIRLTESEFRNLIRQKIMEQDEEFEELTPQEYMNLLSLIGYNAKMLEKTKRFRGKRIKINGNLELKGIKELKNLGTIYLNGSLYANSSGLETLDGTTITDFTYIFDTPLQRKLDRIKRNKELAEADERRQNKEWDLDNPDIDELGEKANAAFRFFISEQGIEPLNNDEKDELERLRIRSNEIEDLMDETEDPDEIDELDSELNDIQYDISELEGRNIDVYGMIPMTRHYDMQTFESRYDDLSDTEIAVGTEDEADSSLYDYYDGLLDDMGYKGFNRWIVERNIDGDEVADYLEDDIREGIYASPSSYDVIILLSKDQKEEIWILKMEKWVYENYGVRFPIKYGTMEDNGKTFDFMDDEDNHFKLKNDGKKWALYKDGSVVEPFKIYDDEDTQDHQDDRDSRITDIEYEIESIEDEPDGDLDEESIEEIVEDQKHDISRNPMHYINEYGLDYENFINREEFLRDVIRNEDYGSLASYDGEYDEININGTGYIVVWLNK